MISVSVIVTSCVNVGITVFISVEPTVNVSVGSMVLTTLAVSVDISVGIRGCKFFCVFELKRPFDLN